MLDTTPRIPVLRYYLMVDSFRQPMVIGIPESRLTC